MKRLNHLLLLCCAVLALRDHPPQGRDPYIPDYAEHYYYTSIGEKMMESLSVNNCTISSNGFVPDGGYSPEEGNEPDLFVKVIPPKMTLQLYYKAIMDAQRPNATRSKSLSRLPGDVRAYRQFVQITNDLCRSDLWKKFKLGHYARAKGCLKMVRDGVKLVNPYGATLHPDHSRCDFKHSATVCVTGSHKPTRLDSPNRANTQFPFLVTMKNALVARSGQAALACGPFGLFSSCEAVNWGLAAAINMVPHVHECYTAPQRGSSDAHAHAHDPHNHAVHCPYKKVDRIFLTSQYDDTQIGQFILESLPRLVYNLPMLYANPDIKIHFGFTKQPEHLMPTEVLPHGVFRWLGLADRLINGTVWAKEAYMPREGACQEPGYNMWELFNMREVFLAKAAKEIGTGGRNNTGSPGGGWASRSFGKEDIMRQDMDCDDGPLGSRPVIVLIKRSASTYTKNQNDYIRRRWPGRHGGAVAVRDHLLRVFPTHRVKIFSDMDDEMMTCIACQVQLFSTADMVVAMHGAGITNTIYMKPGGLVVECVPNFDSRMAPIVGIFPRLSAMAGLHHFTYWIPDNVGFSPEVLANSTRDFHRNVRMWQHVDE